LRCHVDDFLNARPYLGYETEKVIKEMNCSDSDEESMRKAVSILLRSCLMEVRQSIATNANTLKKTSLMSAE